jgi:hypothetical protein
LKVTAVQQNPDFVYRFFDSNNFKWKNEFPEQKIINATIAYEEKPHSIKVLTTYYTISNYIYLNENAYPSQALNNLAVSSITICKNFIYRNWHFNNTFIYQKANLEYIHIPNIITEQTLYLEKKYFRNALLLATGISLNFNSAYYADAFMPANGLFYSQDETKTGGYPRFDIFAIGKIKTARIFLKMENAFDGLFKRSYYLTPHYPMPGRVLKFGLVWRFFDQ